MDVQPTTHTTGHHKGIPHLGGTGKALTSLPVSHAEAENASLRARIQERIDISYACRIPADLRHLFSAFSGKMQGFDLSDLNFNLADMQDIDFTGVNFRRSTFQHSNLARCTLRHTDFSYAVLKYANLTETVIDHTLFEGTYMQYVKLERVMPVQTDFGTARALTLPPPLEYLLPKQPSSKHASTRKDQ